VGAGGREPDGDLGALPIALLSFFAAVLLASFLEYAIHRLMHAGVVLRARHAAHHRDGWGQGFWPELRDYLLPGLPVVLPPWLLGPAVGTGWTLGIVLSALFMAYAHQLQHDNPRACRWMRLPVHYVHHRDQMWHHNFGMAFDLWDRLFGTYKVVPFGDEFHGEGPRGAFEIHWGAVDPVEADEQQREKRVRLRALRPARR